MRAAHVDPKPGKDVIEFYAREHIELAKGAPENEPA
jgi:hypothetical protein